MNVLLTYLVNISNENVVSTTKRLHNIKDITNIYFYYIVSGKKYLIGAFYMCGHFAFRRKMLSHLKETLKSKFKHINFNIWSSEKQKKHEVFIAIKAFKPNPT